MGRWPRARNCLTAQRSAGECAGGNGRLSICLCSTLSSAEITTLLSWRLPSLKKEVRSLKKDCTVCYVPSPLLQYNIYITQLYITSPDKITFYWQLYQSIRLQIT